MTRQVAISLALCAGTLWGVTGAGELYGQAPVPAAPASVADSLPPIRVGERIRIHTARYSNPLVAGVAQRIAGDSLLFKPDVYDVELWMPMSSITQVQKRFTNPHLKTRVLVPGVALTAFGVLAGVAVDALYNLCDDCDDPPRRNVLGTIGRVGGTALAFGSVGALIGFLVSPDQWRTVWEKKNAP